MEDANSWLRRTKFSHTVYYRLDSLRLASIPLTIQPPINSVGQTKVVTAPSHHRSTLRYNESNNFLNKQRSLSPSPQTTLSGALKDARTDQKRFATPQPQRRESIKEKGKRVFCKEAKVHSSLKEEKLKSPLKQLASLKGSPKSKFMKESSWTKCFEHSGGRVTAVEAVDELSVDLSKLFLGNRFAYGAHSRLYHGIYYDKVVAVKIINLPDDDENGDLTARLTKQFGREVTLLSRLHHPNVIKVNN